MRTDTALVMRYLGAKTPDEALTAAVSACIEETEAVSRPKTVFRVFSLEAAEGGTRLTGTDVVLPGRTAGKMLSASHGAALLVGTLGFSFEALLRRVSAADMARAVILDACGSAFLETVLDEAENGIRSALPGKYLTDRFSPGYGDLPLSLQPGILSALGGEKRTGVHVNEAFMLAPSKTVTAVIGIADTPQKARVRGCGSCTINRDCPYYDGGTVCHAN